MEEAWIQIGFKKDEKGTRVHVDSENVTTADVFMAIGSMAALFKRTGTDVKEETMFKYIHDTIEEFKKIENNQTI